MFIPQVNYALMALLCANGCMFWLFIEHGSSVRFIHHNYHADDYAVIIHILSI